MVLTAAPIGKNFQIAKVNGKDEVSQSSGGTWFCRGC